MNTYAKGPWSVSKYDAHIGVKAKSGRTIANCSPFETNCNIPPLMAIANAKLMARAPELLDILEEILHEADEDWYNNSPLAYRARKLIAKIEGRKG